MIAKNKFLLKFKDDANASPVEIMEQNVHQLELLCKRAIKENFQVVLISPQKIEKPQNIYELSVLLAEDMVMKYNQNNIIERIV